MLAILGVAVLVIFVTKGLFALRFRWWLLHFLAREEALTAHRLLAGYVRGPYWRVLERSGADLIRSMFDNTAAVYGMVIGPYMLIATEGLTVVAVVAFLLVVLPLPTLAAIGFFGLAALALNAVVKRTLPTVGGAARRRERAVVQGGAARALRDQGDQGPPRRGPLPRGVLHGAHPVGPGGRP